MKILVIGVDNSILIENSITAKRAKEYGAMVEKYTVVVPQSDKQKIIFSDQVTAYGSGGLVKPTQFFRIFRICYKLLSEEKFDVITLQDPFELALIGLILARKFKLGLNVQEHGDVFTHKFWRNENLRNFLRYYLGLYILRQADSIRAVSQNIKHNLVEQFGLDPDKIITFPVHAEHDINLKKCRIEKSDKDFTFLWLGRFVKQKNLPLLVRAFANVLKTLPDVKLRLVGRGREYKKVLDLIYKLKIEKNIEVKDWTDEKWCEYTQADCYVLSSNYEGWGLVIIEAALSKLPIIMTDVGCAGEVIENEKSGLVVPIGHQEKLEEAMIRLATDKDLAIRLETEAEKRIEQLPTKEEILKLYKKSWEMAVVNNKIREIIK